MHTILRPILTHTHARSCFTCSQTEHTPTRMHTYTNVLNKHRSSVLMTHTSHTGAQDRIHSELCTAAGVPSARSRKGRMRAVCTHTARLGRDTGGTVHTTTICCTQKCYQQTAAADSILEFTRKRKREKRVW